MDDPFAVGRCFEPGERTKQTYERRVGGTARALRKKVLMVHLPVKTKALPWTDEGLRRVELSASAVARFYEREAARYDVDDVDVRVVRWPFEAKLPIPRVTAGASDIVSTEAALALRRAVARAFRAATRQTLNDVAESYYADGYDEVVFLAYLPITSSARSFAFRHGAGDDDAELAFVFTTDTLVGMASAAAHEGLHLFGAADIYRSRRRTTPTSAT